MAENLLFNAALEKAMAICAGREMCTYDISRKLISWGIKDDSAVNILNILTRDKFIDEERFAVAFVKDKFRYNKWGKVKISNALKIKRIHNETIKHSLKSINDEEYLDLLKSILAKQKKTIKAKNQFDLKGKLLRHCISKGFESHLVYDLLNDPED